MPCLATSSSDPNSKNGIMTKVWGPAGWLFLHCVTFGYPDNPDLYDAEYGLAPGTTRSRYRRFFNEFGNVLPCRYCRDSYKEFIKEDKLEDNIQDRDHLIEWFWRTGKGDKRSTPRREDKEHRRRTQKRGRQ